MTYWSKYNQELKELANKLIVHNEKNKFNFIEEGFYNHVHDILLLAILKFDDNSEIKVLDYGSNILPWSNVINKINTSQLKITIFDPFIKSKNKIDISNNFDLTITNEEKDFKKEKFDLQIFGSSSQYIDNFFDNLNLYLYSSRFIFFTHTPLSINKTFVSNQYTGFKGKQIIRSYDELISFMKENKYEIIFKSILPSQYASVDKDKINQTIYANLLFKKLDN
ncbi:hypothetical protein HA149_07110 [Prochlorococcus marinus XMU1406]|uniref:hypothetical protein n=1 Tax=Prochlorococcus marinus TaxID=1219 RepID=UPI001ADB20DF|nr:hypothetical protein [Prochlorococcus marinus]MBO8206826.1 hypothetical protein [Prochlorococcus marinus XMU1406]MCR8542645.1 hypothetical protein [Prochlorococcus marinus XMU1427]